MREPIHIRLAEVDDAQAITDIYNQSIPSRNATADMELQTVESRQQWFDEHDEHYPIFVAEREGEVAGWISLSPYRHGREALRSTAEVSYYIADAHQRKGVASALMNHILEYLPGTPIRNIFGIIIETNEGSVSFMKKYGFEQWAHLPNVLNFGDGEVGQVYYGKRVR